MSPEERAYAAEQRVALLEKELDEARKGLWNCPNCAFSFAAEHTNADGSYTCPVCAEARLEKELAEAKGLLIKSLAESVRCDICGETELVQAACGNCNDAEALRVAELVREACALAVDETDTVESGSGYLRGDDARSTLVAAREAVRALDLKALLSGGGP